MFSWTRNNSMCIGVAWIQLTFKKCLRLSSVSFYVYYKKYERLQVAARVLPAASLPSSAHSCWQTSYHVTWGGPEMHHGECRTDASGRQIVTLPFYSQHFLFTTTVTNMKIKKKKLPRYTADSRSYSKWLNEQNRKVFYSQKRGTSHSKSLYRKERNKKKGKNWFTNAFENIIFP